MIIFLVCLQGSLRAALDHKLLIDRTTGLPALECVLFLAHDVACAMIHLHSEQLLHGDLKASNVLLKRTAPRLPVPPEQLTAGGGGGRTAQLMGLGLGLMAKVADFGLSLTLGPAETHVSQMHMVSDACVVQHQQVPLYAPAKCSCCLVESEDVLLNCRHSDSMINDTFASHPGQKPHHSGRLLCRALSPTWRLSCSCMVVQASPVMCMRMASCSGSWPLADGPTVARLLVCLRTRLRSRAGGLHGQGGVACLCRCWQRLAGHRTLQSGEQKVANCAENAFVACACPIVAVLLATSRTSVAVPAQYNM